jgi:hypothetical protein
MNERAILMEEGLLYRDGTTGEYVVPGTLIVDQVLRDSSLKTELAAVVTESPTGEGGTLWVEGTCIGLKGNAWRVLRLLWDRRGEYLSLDELKPDSRNSIQRLREELKRHNCAYLVENEYGKGYRFLPRQ